MFCLSIIEWNNIQVTLLSGGKKARYRQGHIICSYLYLKRKGDIETVVDVHVDIDKCSGRLYQQLIKVVAYYGERAQESVYPFVLFF